MNGSDCAVTKYDPKIPDKIIKNYFLLKDVDINSTKSL